jgi:hypothetical protein
VLLCADGVGTVEIQRRTGKARAVSDQVA